MDQNHNNPTDEQSNEQQQEPQENAPSPKTSSSRLAGLGKKFLIFGALAIIFIVAYCIVNIDSITGFIDLVGGIIEPLIIGGIIAYLFNPVLEFYEYRAFRRMKNGDARRGLSLLLTVLTAIAVIALFLLMIIPKLIESISDLANNYQTYVDNLLGVVQNLVNTLAEKFEWDVSIEDVEDLKAMLLDFFGNGANIFESIMSFVKESGIVSDVGNALMDVVTVFKNWILGIFIAFYILSSKEKRVAQVSKFRRAIFNKKQNQRISDVANLVDKTFSGFVFGVLIDALVVGIMTFVLLSIFKVSPKYNLLIAVICAVTNIIPVFGPFIGAIPSALIVLISNPSKFFLFIILVLIIQQIDGNLLCPKIQGDNTGISSLAVLIAITIAGNIGGILGMIIGVPIFAVLIELVKQFLDHKLEKMGEPVDTTAYYPEDALGNAEKDVYYEHASLRYEYEHSKFKIRWERVKNRIFRHLGRQSKKDQANQNTNDNGSDTTPPQN